MSLNSAVQLLRKSYIITSWPQRRTYEFCVQEGEFEKEELHLQAGERTIGNSVPVGCCGLASYKWQLGTAAAAPLDGRLGRVHVIRWQSAAPLLACGSSSASVRLHGLQGAC